MSGPEVQWLSREQRLAVRLRQAQEQLEARAASVKQLGPALAGMTWPIATVPEGVPAAVAVLGQTPGLVTPKEATGVGRKKRARQEAFDGLAAWVDGLSEEERDELPASEWYGELSAKNRDLVDDVLVGHMSEEERAWFGRFGDADDDEGYSAEYGGEAA